MDNTVIQQGYFTSDGTAKILSIRSDVDWMRVINWTQAATQQGTGRGVEFYWQRGMAADTGVEYKKTNSTDALNMVTLSSGGFTLIDTSVQAPGALVSTISAVSTASIPVVTNSGTNGLVAGDVVRLINVAGAPQLGGMDFTVGYNTLSTTTFSLDYMAQLSVAGTTGSWRKISYNPLYYPRRRFITKITQASQAVVTLSVTHQFTVGQLVRFYVPSAYGMSQINGLQGEITAINTTTTSGNTVTVNIDSSGFDAFAFPLAAAFPFTQAQLVPVGEGTDASIASPNLLDDATINQGLIGMRLAAGAQSPAGSSSDLIYWTAGKSFSNSTS